MELFSIGQMAKINHVTKKTLMLYQRMGLLEPKKVDEETGYRYYTIDQCSTLDMILQLQQIGFSLSEIKKAVSRGDVSALRAEIVSRVGMIDRETERLNLARGTACELIRSCDQWLSQPEFYKITLEYVPRRPYLFYRTEPYIVQTRWEENPGLSNWENRLRVIKRRMLEDGHPLALFHNVCCVIDKDSLHSRKFVCTGGYVLCPGGYEGPHDQLPEGWCLTVMIPSMFDGEGNHLENKYTGILVDAIEKEGYRIRGDYYCEIIAETPAFLFHGRDMMLCMRIPVDVDDPQTSPYYQKGNGPVQ